MIPLKSVEVLGENRIDAARAAKSPEILAGYNHAIVMKNDNIVAR